jgi:hypothetical protein
LGIPDESQFQGIGISAVSRAASAKATLSLIAGWIGIISTRGPAVIVWGCHCCTDGSGTQAHTHATAHVCSPIDAAAMYASAIDAAICQGVGRNARDAKGGDQGKRDDSSK